jgi:diacylglycerol kinase family enzyme
MTRRILLIANPSAAAGRVAGRWEKLLADLEAQQVKVDYVLTDHPGHAIDLAREAARKYDVVAAGTVNEVASGILLAGPTNAMLGVVPAGTGNDVAHVIGVRTMDDATRALAEGTPQAMDVIEVDCDESGKRATRYALLYASVGFAGELFGQTPATFTVKPKALKVITGWGVPSRSA